MKIETYSAKYVVTGKAVRVYARWNHASQEKEKTLVGLITWDRNRGPWRRRGSRLYGSGVVLEFDDYHCRVTVPAASPDLSYTYAPAFPATWKAYAQQHSRVWMDDEIGFQVMFQGSSMTLRPGQVAGFAALPSRPIARHVLYGERPHVAFCLGVKDGTDHDDLIMADPDEWLGRLEDRGFGVLVLWNHFYTRGHVPEADPVRYVLRDDKRERYGELIRLAHTRGWKVIAYVESHHFHERIQDVILTDSWLDEFHAEHDLDGFYFDGWRMADQWYRCYDWAKSLRRRFEIIYVHNTVDVWGAWTGLVAHPQLAYADYVLHGERVDLVGLDDPYLDYVTNSRSGAIADHKLKPGEVTWPEIYRLIGRYGSARQGVGNNLSTWDGEFLPHYKVAKEAYVESEDQ